MERLTIDLSEGGIDDIGYSNPNDPYGMYDILDLARLSECDDGTCASILLEISNKLSAYENTVLTPSEIEQLKKENVELRARLEKSVELPCKIGDMVYFEVKGYDHWHTYQNFIQKQEITMIILRNDFIKFQTASKTYYLEDFGKTVFLTQKEAEQALKENENNE